MSDEQDKLKLSLEPPKLFGRKKKSDAPEAAKKAPPAPAARRRPPARPAPVEPAPEADQTPAEEAGVEEVATEEPRVGETPATTADTETQAVEAGPGTAATGASEQAAAPAAKKTTGAARTRTTRTRPPAKPAPPIEPEPVTSAELEDAEIAAAAADDDPLLTPYRAGAVTGLIVGAAMVVLTWLFLRGCEGVRGTASCGNGPGFLLLIATFVVCVMLGRTLLKTFLVPDPGSTSFMAVALVAVVALLFLIDAVDHWSMLVVVPLLSVAGYLASVWITKTFVEPADT